MATWLEQLRPWQNRLRRERVFLPDLARPSTAASASAESERRHLCHLWDYRRSNPCHFSANSENPFLSKKSFFSKGHVSPVNKMKNKGWGALFPSYRIAYWCIAVWSMVLIGKAVKLCHMSRRTQYGFPSFSFWSQLHVMELMLLNKIVPPLEKEERLEFAICGDMCHHVWPSLSLPMYMSSVMILIAVSEDPVLDAAAALDITG